jgi:hypothetical protein
MLYINIKGNTVFLICKEIRRVRYRYKLQIHMLGNVRVHAKLGKICDFFTFQHRIFYCHLSGVGAHGLGKMNWCHRVMAELQLCD